MNEQLTRLGAGPVGTVFRADSDGFPSALKVFPSRFDRRTLAAADREFRQLGQLRMPSVLVPFRIEQLPDGRHAIRMELCTQSLTALVQRRGPLPPADVVVLGYAAAAALASAHAVGVIHGAVNPDNILFRPTGEPVVSDFGLSLRRAFTRDPMHGVESLPPESLRDDVLDPRTDLYGLGAALHFALTGRSPHPGRLGEHLGERLLRVLREPVPPVSFLGVPAPLTALVSGLLAADPANRPASAAFVADRFAELMAYQQRNVEPYPQRNPLGSRPAPPQPAPSGKAAYAGFQDALRIIAAIDKLPPAGDPDDVTESKPPSVVAEIQPPPVPVETPPPPAQEFNDFEEPTGTPEHDLDNDDGKSAAAFADNFEQPPPSYADDVDEPQPAPSQPVPSRQKTPPPYDPPPANRRSIPYGLVTAAAAVVAAIAIPLVLLLQASPPELPTTPRALPSSTPAPTASAVKDVKLELANPTDLGNQVVLSWTSTATNMDFAVVVAQENGPTTAVLAKRAHTINIAVDPARKYCFLIQGVDSSSSDVVVYQSKPKPLRGAVCKE
ncbi:serine/threonine protein kinase [Fodinicola acaciae]|uniref:serine/threonine protein kinase n=1 Tax=Fodinicola acaciae TaxID=2681555 RepID=UPI0013D0ECAE|nr:protein kinase [Fodinicola acaciae]